MCVVGDIRVAADAGTSDTPIASQARPASSGRCADAGCGNCLPVTREIHPRRVRTDCPLPPAAKYRRHLPDAATHRAGTLRDRSATMPAHPQCGPVALGADNLTRPLSIFSPKKWAGVGSIDIVKSIRSASVAQTLPTEVHHIAIADNGNRARARHFAVLAPCTPLNGKQE